MQNTYPGNPDDNIKRFIYNDLEPGTYVLQNMNGKDGLNPAVYNGGGPPVTSYFQNQAYLNYQMTINSVANSGFMDFNPYAANLPGNFTPR